MTLSPTDYERRVKGALEALNNLGSPDAIADHLATMGVKGCVGISTRCPVANYVALVAPAPNTKFSVGWKWWHAFTDVHPSYPWPPEPTFYGSVPDHVNDFVAQFDMGTYPGLKEDMP